MIILKKYASFIAKCCKITYYSKCIHGCYGMARSCKFSKMGIKKKFIRKLRLDQHA